MSKPQMTLTAEEKAARAKVLREAQTTPFYVCQPCGEQLAGKKAGTGIPWSRGTCQYCAMKYVAIADAKRLGAKYAE